MGKRKSSKKVVKEVRKTVMTKFDCPFCNHAGCIKITM
jgi:transcription elongation factor Elf1